MKILITGITSELLQRLVKLIDAKTCDITGVTRFPEKISSEKIKIIKGDICDPDTAEKIITDDMDMIIHGAAVTHSRDENEYFKVNLNSTISIINFLKQKNRKCMFVFISSRTAGKKSGAYGFSKFLAEEYIRKNLNRWLIFRPSEIFGTEKKEGIGKLISDALAKSIIFYPANMKYKIYPIHIDDVVNIMYESIFITRKSNEIITINGNEGYTYYELLKCISSINKRKIMFIPIPKFLLFLLKYIIKILSLKIFITPDQIDRLYSEKYTCALNFKTKNIIDYAKELNSSKKIFNIIADDYNNIRKNEYGFAGNSHYFEKVRAEYINELLPDGKKIILEAGSGQSQLYKLISQDSVVIAADISFNMLLNNNTPLKLNMDIFSIPFKPETVDSIIFINVLHHIGANKFNKLFLGLRDMLKSGGSIIICEHNPFNPLTRYIVNSCSFDKGCLIIHPKEIICSAEKTGLKTRIKKYILYFPEKLQKIRHIEKFLNYLPFGSQYIISLHKEL